MSKVTAPLWCHTGRSPPLPPAPRRPLRSEGPSRALRLRTTGQPGGGWYLGKSALRRARVPTPQAQKALAGTPAAAGTDGLSQAHCAALLHRPRKQRRAIWQFHSWVHTKKRTHAHPVCTAALLPTAQPREQRKRPSAGESRRKTRRRSTTQPRKGTRLCRSDAAGPGEHRA